MVTSILFLCDFHKKYIKFREEYEIISGSGATARKKKSVQDLDCSVKHFKKVQAELCGTRKVSYTKLKYMNELLWETVIYSEKQYGESFWNANALAKGLCRGCATVS